MQFEVSVIITHEAKGKGVRLLPKPHVSQHGPFDRREDAVALVERLENVADQNNMRPYLTTVIRPVNRDSTVAGQILTGGIAIVGETLADVLNLDTWTETRGVTSSPLPNHRT